MLSTRPGVFSHGELDEGTRALSEVAVVGEATRVADLGCGSGALGIESLSRGAKHATFVERDRDAVGILKFNLAALGILEGYEIFEWDVVRWLDTAHTQGFMQRIASALAVG